MQKKVDSRVHNWCIFLFDGSSHVQVMWWHTHTNVHYINQVCIYADRWLCNLTIWYLPTILNFSLMLIDMNFKPCRHFLALRLCAQCDSVRLCHPNTMPLTEGRYLVGVGWVGRFGGEKGKSELPKQPTETLEISTLFDWAIRFWNWWINTEEIGLQPVKGFFAPKNLKVANKPKQVLVCNKLANFQEDSTYQTLWVPSKMC